MNQKKQVRAKFKNDVFARDKYICQVCKKIGLEVELDAHHITDRNEMPNGGYVLSNGITVHKDVCHMKVERFHISGGKNWEDGLHPNDLYKLIGSSKEKAIDESLKLL